ncbi:Single-stranded nucleic acid binding R3H [Neofusicoccum parvum]|nr:Single-stranded nucleic acid binding R3H [Neofusicoccum parvum]
MPHNSKDVAAGHKAAQGQQAPVILQKPSELPEAQIADNHIENGEKDETSNQEHAPDTNGSSKDAHAQNGVSSDSNAEQSMDSVSSSNSSAKPPSVDGKSVASGTTFALDEKESIRPDDSASIRAVEEDREDVFSPPDSVAAGSRVGSENGIGRAFRDQLNEISVMGASSQRGILPGRNVHIMSSSEVAQAASGRPASLPLGAIQENDGTSQPQPVPDEKLLEALQSPRDRLFVLKLEQDVLDFLRNTAEKELDVPNCNAFYRMLAHRFADYYLLGHVVDPVTSAVKITKTPYSRIDAGQGPRKLTREEREAKYKEARQRIFGSAEDGDLGESTNNSESKDMSRSSSAAGKKTKKKNRNNDDDGFEARSQFSPYYPGQYGGPGYSGDAPPMYYGPYTNMVPPSTNMPQNGSAPMQYNNGYPVMVQQDPQQQFAWQYQQFGSPNQTMNATPYGAPMPMNYDISQDFQRMSFQPGNGSNQTPKMSNPTLAGFPDGYNRPQSQGMNQPWPMSGQMPYQFAQQGYNDRPMSAGQNPYPYGQLPNPQFGNNRNQHPLPGSFNRQQFNPQSQAFVPSFGPGPGMRGGGGFGMPGQSPQMGVVAPNMVGFPNFNMPMHQQQPPRPSQPTSQPQFNRPPGNPTFVKNPGQEVSFGWQPEQHRQMGHASASPTQAPAARFDAAYPKVRECAAQPSSVWTVAAAKPQWHVSDP